MMRGGRVWLLYSLRRTHEYDMHREGERGGGGLSSIPTDSHALAFSVHETTVGVGTCTDRVPKLWSAGWKKQRGEVSLKMVFWMFRELKSKEYPKIIYVAA